MFFQCSCSTNRYNVCISPYLAPDIGRTLPWLSQSGYHGVEYLLPLSAQYAAVYRMVRPRADTANFPPLTIYISAVVSQSSPTLLVQNASNAREMSSFVSTPAWFVPLSNPSDPSRPSLTDSINPRKGRNTHGRDGRHHQRQAHLV